MDRYRQILEKAIQLSDVEQLEALKAFVEASKCIWYNWLHTERRPEVCGIAYLLALH